MIFSPSSSICSCWEAENRRETVDFLRSGPTPASSIPANPDLPSLPQVFYEHQGELRVLLVPSLPPSRPRPSGRRAPPSASAPASKTAVSGDHLLAAPPLSGPPRPPLPIATKQSLQFLLVREIRARQWGFGH